VTNLEQLIEEYKDRAGGGGVERKLVRVTVGLTSATHLRLTRIAERFQMTNTRTAEEILEAALRKVEQRLAERAGAGGVGEWQIGK